jgi:hypothetical protein
MLTIWLRMCQRQWGGRREARRQTANRMRSGRTIDRREKFYAVLRDVKLEAWDAVIMQAGTLFRGASLGAEMAGLESRIACDENDR